MRASPTILPNSPSIGITPIQRRCPGKRPSNAGTNTTSQIPPSDLATGDMTLRERNQRVPSTAAKTGSRYAPMPKNCSIRSETMAPTNPIQLRAAREPVSTDALLNDGSSGEYEASARKRRSAETHSRNPISSLSRRLLVGAKIRDKYVIGRNWHRAQTTPLPPVPALRQSQTIMPRTGQPYNQGFEGQYPVSSRLLPASVSPGSSWLVQRSWFTTDDTLRLRSGQAPDVENRFIPPALPQIPARAHRG